MNKKQASSRKRKENFNFPIKKKRSGKKILIVDDEKEIRDLIRETLTIDEFNVFEAESGDLALKVIREQNPDLILMDVVMPGSLNGFDVCCKIKADETTKKIPVLFLTAFPVKEVKKCEICEEQFFYKPFSPIQLVNKIYDVLNSKIKF